MSYTRRIAHYSPGPTDFVSVISDRAVEGAWFELRRQGGCGAGEVRLIDAFSDRNVFSEGDWIAFEFDTGDRWYLGRIEHITADIPSGITLHLTGMGAELDEVFPGGFGRNIADGIPPHRYAKTDLFWDDPDYSDESVDTLSEPHELVTLLMQQYVVPKTDITLDLSRIESGLNNEQVLSYKFRGEETVRDILAELATCARNASWGVDENGKFFFLQQKTSLAATYRDGVDIISLEESRDRAFLFNRVLLTGGYVYQVSGSSDQTIRDIYRWRGNYIQPASRSQYGERRIRISVPWIRTRTDSREFLREFFRVYSQPTLRYLVEVGNQSVLPRPWEGRIRIEDSNGNELITRQIEAVRVQFDHSPHYRMEIGPEDPQLFWPDSPHDERWELPAVLSLDSGSDIITFPISSSSLSGSSSFPSSSVS